MGIPALPFCRASLKANRPAPQGYPAKPATLGEHIKKRRLDLKLFQKDVARMIGVDDTSIWNWKNNQSKPVSRLAPKIWGFLGYCPVNLRANDN
jgi:DNA-binding XRE family transcriptional regulator